MKNKTLFPVIALLILATSAHALDLFGKKSNDLVMLYRVVVNPEANAAFYGDYAAILNPEDADKDTQGAKPENSLTLYLNNTWRDFEYTEISGSAPFYIANATLTGERKIVLDGILYNPGGVDTFRVMLPLSGEFIVPGDVRYVYLGTFVYNVEGYQFAAEKPVRIDELDAAKEYFAKNFGEEAVLSPVFIKSLPFQEKSEE